MLYEVITPVFSIPLLPRRWPFRLVVAILAGGMSAAPIAAAEDGTQLLLLHSVGEAANIPVELARRLSYNFV